MLSYLDWVDSKGFFVKSEVVADGRLKLWPHQREVLGYALTPDAEGKLPFSTILYSTVKKSGKTSVAASIAAWYMEEVAPPGSEIYFCASSKEHAEGLAMRMLKWHVYKRFPDAKISQWEVTLPNGTKARALAKQYKTVAGTQVALSIWDELWGYELESDLRMWAEMTASPTVKNPLKVIVTYAGFYDADPNLLLNLYEDNVERGTVVPQLEHLKATDGRSVCTTSGRVFVYWDNVPRMPWQTNEYYENEIRNLRPADFLRLHRNQWVTTHEEFIPVEWWDRATTLKHSWLTMPPDVRLPVSIGIDVGIKHDCSAVVGVYFDFYNRKLGLAFHRIWTPVGEEGLDLENTVERFLMEMNTKYHVLANLYDPAQFHRSMTTLTKYGLPMIQYTQSQSNMIEATQALYDALRQGVLEVYPDEELRDHVRFSVAETKGRGHRIIKEKHAKYKIDAAVALAIAVWDAVARGGVDTKKPILIASPFSDATAWKTDISKEPMWLPWELRR